MGEDTIGGCLIGAFDEYLAENLDVRSTSEKPSLAFAWLDTPLVVAGARLSAEVRSGARQTG